MRTLRRLAALAALLLGVLILNSSSYSAPVPAAPTDDQLKEIALKLNDLKDTDAMQAKLTELLKNKDNAKRLINVATKLQKSSKDTFKFPAALILAKIAHNVKEFEAAETFYEKAADISTKSKEGARMLQSYEGWLDLYWDQKKYQNVEEVARKMLDSQGGREFEEAKPFVLERLVQSKAKQGDTDEAMRMAEGLVQLDRGGWYFLQLKGWVQREAGKIDDAITTYEDVLDKLDEAKGLKDDAKARLKRNVRYLLSGLHVDNKNIDKAASQLQKLIKDEPERATYYNDLGFIWADNDKNLEESEKLIRKALEMDAKERKKLLEEKKIDAEVAKKENAAYLDSLGWVLYKRGKLDEALKYLQEATKDDEEGQHIEIWDHLADVLLAQGKTKEAIEIWQKSLKFEDVSPRDKERRKKVTEKLKKARAALAK